MATQIQIDDVKEKFAELQILKNQLSALEKEYSDKIQAEDKKRNDAVKVIQTEYTTKLNEQKTKISELTSKIESVK